MFKNIAIYCDKKITHDSQPDMFPYFLINYVVICACNYFLHQGTVAIALAREFKEI